MDVSSSSLSRSVIGEAFENDDYDYLINCTDLITTCQEALRDGDDSVECSESVESSEDHHHHMHMHEHHSHHPYLHHHDHLLPHHHLHHHHHPHLHLEGAKGGAFHHYDHHESSSLRAPSSAASSGLGLSLEEDGSLKYCHSDEEFSSLNSTVGGTGVSGVSIINESLPSPSSSSSSSVVGSTDYSGKALVAEFIEWLDYAEKRLDSLCYCAKIQSASQQRRDSSEANAEPTTTATATADTELNNGVSVSGDYVNELSVNRRQHHPLTPQHRRNRIRVEESDFICEENETTTTDKGAYNPSLVLSSTKVVNDAVNEEQQKQAEQSCFDAVENEEDSCTHTDTTLDNEEAGNRPQRVVVAAGKNYGEHEGAHCHGLDETEAEEWMMSLSPMAQSTPKGGGICSNSTSVVLRQKKSARRMTNKNRNVASSNTEYSSSSIDSINTNSSCNVDWDAVLAGYKSFHNEFERICHRFLKEIAEHKQQHQQQQQQQQQQHAQQHNRTVRHERDRCLALWIKSLEYLIILQESPGQRCPRHYLSTNRSRRAANNRRATPESSPLPPVDFRTSTSLFETAETIETEREHLLETPSSADSQQNGSKRNKRRNYTLLFSSSGGSFSPYRSLLSGGNSRSLGFHTLGVFDPKNQRHPAEQEVPPSPPSLKSVRNQATGGDHCSVWTASRRVQTTATAVNQHYHDERCTQSETEATMIEPDFHRHYRHYPSDTHSLDGSGSPSADSGVFSSSTLDPTGVSPTGDGSKHDIIQKDIGYSSDADMSDEVNGQVNGAQAPSRSSRKSKVKRRRARTTRPRPWSYHADWTDWDYYQTPFLSTEDILNEHEQENALRRLTEFGENYEHWFASTELDNELNSEAKFAQLTADDLFARGQGQENEEARVEDEEVHEHVAELECSLSEPEVVNNDFESELSIIEKKDASCSPIPFLVEERVVVSSRKSKKNKHHRDVGCMTVAPVKDNSTSTVTSTQCTHCDGHCSPTPSKPYSSIKFYTSLALSGLFAIFFAVSQFSPEIEKTYSRPPPI